MEAFTEIRIPLLEKWRGFLAAQDRDIGLRILWGAIVAAVAIAACVLLLPPWDHYSDYLHLRGRLLLVWSEKACFAGMCLVFLARVKPDLCKLKYLLIPGVVCVVGCQVAFSECRIQPFEPLLRGLGQAVMVAAIIHVIRSNMPVLSVRWIFTYLAALVGSLTLMLGLFFAPIYVISHPGEVISHALREADLLRLSYWGLALDLGQRFGGSTLARKHSTSLFAVACLTLAIVLVVERKQIAAERQYSLGMAYYFGDMVAREAIGTAHFERAHRLWPANERMAYMYAWAIRERGELCFSKKDFDLAIAEYQRAIEIFPKDPDHYSHMGRAYHQMGDLQGAIDYLRKAIRLEQESTRADWQQWARWAPTDHERMIFELLLEEGSEESIQEILRLTHDRHDVYTAISLLARHGRYKAIVKLKEELDRRADASLRQKFDETVDAFKLKLVE